MNVFDKKFQDMLKRSDEHNELTKRVSELETQVDTLTKALADAMKAYTNLAKITIDNRKSLEEIYSFMTDPLGEATAEEAAPAMTPEELAEYKRNLN